MLGDGYGTRFSSSSIRVSTDAGMWVMEEARSVLIGGAPAARVWCADL